MDRTPLIPSGKPLVRKPKNFTELQGWSITALANACGVEVRQVQSWENTTGHRLMRKCAYEKCDTLMEFSGGPRSGARYSGRFCKACKREGRHFPPGASGRREKKPKADLSGHTRESLAEDVERFLAAGGKVRHGAPVGNVLWSPVRATPTHSGGWRG